MKLENIILNFDHKIITIFTYKDMQISISIQQKIILIN